MVNCSRNTWFTLVSGSWLIDKFQSIQSHDSFQKNRLNQGSKLTSRNNFLHQHYVTKDTTRNHRTQKENQETFWKAWKLPQDTAWRNMNFIQSHQSVQRLKERNFNGKIFSSWKHSHKAGRDVWFSWIVFNDALSMRGHFEDGSSSFILFLSTYEKSLFSFHICQVFFHCSICSLDSVFSSGFAYQSTSMILTSRRIHDCWWSSGVLCIHSCIQGHKTNSFWFAQWVNGTVSEVNWWSYQQRKTRTWEESNVRNHKRRIAWWLKRNSRLVETYKENNKRNSTFCWTQSKNLWISQEEECWEESSSSKNPEDCNSFSEAKGNKEIITAHNHLAEVSNMVEWNNYFSYENSKIWQTRDSFKVWMKMCILLMWNHNQRNASWTHNPKSKFWNVCLKLIQSSRIPETFEIVTWEPPWQSLSILQKVQSLQKHIWSGNIQKTALIATHKTSGKHKLQTCKEIWSDCWNSSRSNLLFWKICQNTYAIIASSFQSFKSLFEMQSQFPECIHITVQSVKKNSCIVANITEWTWEHLTTIKNDFIRNTNDCSAQRNVLLIGLIFLQTRYVKMKGIFKSNTQKQPQKDTICALHSIYLFFHFLQDEKHQKRSTKRTANVLQKCWCQNHQ